MHFFMGPIQVLIMMGAIFSTFSCEKSSPAKKSIDENNIMGGMKKEISASSDIVFNHQRVVPHIALALPSGLDRTSKKPGSISTFLSRRETVLDDKLPVNIKYRGNSSFEHYPKKQFSLEFDEKIFKGKTYGLLDFAPNDDYVLYAPYGDKTLIRNVLAYNLSNIQGRYAAKTRFVTLEVSGDPDGQSEMGIYVLMEKIKFARSRIPTLKKNENGQFAYLMRFDRIKDRQFITTENGKKDIVIDYPKEEDLTRSNREFITNYLNTFERNLATIKQNDGSKALEMIDLDSFIDYAIMQELARNIDGYRMSCYFYLPIGGKITFGPVWDFDIAFGNVDRYNGFATEGWHYLTEEDDNWYKILLQDKKVQEALSKKWKELRTGRFSDKKFSMLIDALVATTPRPIIEENFKIWPVLGVKVWPNYVVKPTFDEEVVYLKNWLIDRAHWMDRNL